MSMHTIDLRQALNIRVPDAAGVEKEYQLAEGLNEVPREVAEHWYVKKFSLPVRRVPRVVLPSSARPRPIPAVAPSAPAEAIAPPDEAATVVEPEDGEPAAKA